MTTNTKATKKFFQLVDIGDFRFEKDCAELDYGDIASDCDCKSISLLEAIRHISLNISSLVETESQSKEKIMSLNCIIADLAELVIATNKIAQTAQYLSGLQDGNHG